MNSRRLTAYSMLLIASIIWGVAGPITKYSVAFIPIALFLTYRFLVSGVVGILMTPNAFSIFKQKKYVTSILLYSFFSVTLAIGFFFLGISQTSSLSSSIIGATTPIFTTIAAAIFLHEKVTGRERFGILLAFLGTTLTIVEPLILRGNAPSQESLMGNLFVLFAVLTDIVSWIIAKVALREKIPALKLTTVSFILNIPIFMAILLWSTSIPTIIQTLTEAPLLAHFGVLYMALFSGTLAYFLRNRAIQSIEVSEGSIFMYLQVVWAAPLALFWLRESVGPIFIAGVIVTAIGVFIAEYKKKRAPTTSPKAISRRRRKR